jgi:putative peptidoglycan lipid II flippase
VLLPEMSRRITANDHDGAMRYHVQATLAQLAVAGAIIYALAILALFGRRWLVSLVRG